MKAEYRPLQKIVESMQNRALGGVRNFAYSLGFEELLDEKAKLTPNDRIFNTFRKLEGKYENFEVHYDTEKQVILDIFLVS